MRESLQIQALLARIGEKMGMRIWLPRNDRQGVLDLWQPENENTVISSLPFNYSDVAMRTIENIDVLWVQGNTIRRAFEVEHTTSIYSGILRMADLMALLPNLTITAHIVAPSNRRNKVLQEIMRPVFSYLEGGPLSEKCTYLPYDAIIELNSDERLHYMRDDVLQEFEESANDSLL